MDASRMSRSSIAAAIVALITAESRMVEFDFTSPAGFYRVIRR